MDNPLKRPLTVAFCITGDTFSNKFLLAWTTLFNYCVTHNITPLISNYESKTINHTRNMCLGGNPLHGVDQLPFNGTLEYDFVMFIDGDRLFGVDDFVNLLSEDADVMSGAYLVEQNNEKIFDVIEKYDEAVLSRKGSHNYLTIDEVVVMRKKDQQYLLSVDYMGCGWVLLKKGVLESIKWPWFKTEVNNYTYTDPSGNEIHVKDNTMETFNFCKQLKNKGYDLQVNTKVVVGTERRGLL